MDKNCYFITGGAGFIGSNFINNFFEIYSKSQEIELEFEGFKLNDNSEIKNKSESFKLINFDALYHDSNENNINKKIRNDYRYKFIHGNLQNFDLPFHQIEFINICSFSIPKQH